MTVPDALRRLMDSRSSHAREARVLSIGEAAELLQVGRMTIDAWIESKRLWLGKR